MLNLMVIQTAFLVDYMNGLLKYMGIGNFFSSGSSSDTTGRKKIVNCSINGTVNVDIDRNAIGAAFSSLHSVPEPRPTSPKFQRGTLPRSDSSENLLDEHIESAAITISDRKGSSGDIDPVEGIKYIHEVSKDPKLVEVDEQRFRIKLDISGSRIAIEHGSKRFLKRVNIAQCKYEDSFFDLFKDANVRLHYSIRAMEVLETCTVHELARLPYFPYANQRYKELVLAAIKTVLLAPSTDRESRITKRLIVGCASRYTYSLTAMLNLKHPQSPDDENFDIIQLAGVDLRRMDLKRLNFSGANLDRADLRGSDVKTVNFQWASMKKVNMRGADIKGSFFLGADVQDMNMIGMEVSMSVCRGLDREKVKTRHCSSCCIVC